MVWWDEVLEVVLGWAVVAIFATITVLSLPWVLKWTIQYIKWVGV